MAMEQIMLSGTGLLLIGEDARKFLKNYMEVSGMPDDVLDEYDISEIPLIRSDMVVPGDWKSNWGNLPHVEAEEGLPVPEHFYNAFWVTETNPDYALEDNYCFYRTEDGRLMRSHGRDYALAVSVEADSREAAIKSLQKMLGKYLPENVVLEEHYGGFVIIV